jgi:hypothetical protein
VITVVKSQSKEIEDFLTDVTKILSNIVDDYELIVIDNNAPDETKNLLKKITSQGGLPNIQVFRVIREIDKDAAFWLGIENSLGDFALAIDFIGDDVTIIKSIIGKIDQGAEVVFALNTAKRTVNPFYKIFSKMFNTLYKKLNGIDLMRDAPSFRMLSRGVINFVSQHPDPFLSYRHIPALSGFKTFNLEYKSHKTIKENKNFFDSVDLAVKILITSSKKPLRFLTFLTLIGATFNFLYTFYIILIAVFKNNVAPGWLSLSLQQSFMFFLFSFIFLVLSEYIIQISSLSNSGPRYYISEEYKSYKIKRKEKLNVMDSSKKAKDKKIIWQ